MEAGAKHESTAVRRRSDAGQRIAGGIRTAAHSTFLNNLALSKSEAGDCRSDMTMMPERGLPMGSNGHKQHHDLEKKIVILGAGPTGLGAAYRLQELGYRNWAIYERNSYLGGLATSFV